MYTGEYNHTVDTKGRLILPSKLREALGDEFVVTKGMEGCLFVYDKIEWSKFEEKLNGLSITNRESRKALRFFLSGAVTAEVDKQGRFLIPTNLREHAGLTKDVVLVGCGRNVEIWDKERWLASNENDDIEAIIDYLDDIGVRF